MVLGGGGGWCGVCFPCLGSTFDLQNSYVFCIIYFYSNELLLPLLNRIGGAAAFYWQFLHGKETCHAHHGLGTKREGVADWLLAWIVDGARWIAMSC